MEKMVSCDVGSTVGVTTLVPVRGAPAGGGLRMEPMEPSEAPGPSSAGPGAVGAPARPPRPRAQVSQPHPPVEMGPLLLPPQETSVTQMG